MEIYIYNDSECDAFLETLPTVYAEIDAQTSENGIALRDAVLAFRGK